jgi:hypothetical protein
MLPRLLRGIGHVVGAILLMAGLYFLLLRLHPIWELAYPYIVLFAVFNTIWIVPFVAWRVGIGNTSWQEVAKRRWFPMAAFCFAVTIVFLMVGPQSLVSARYHVYEVNKKTKNESSNVSEFECRDDAYRFAHDLYEYRRSFDPDMSEVDVEVAWRKNVPCLEFVRRLHFILQRVGMSQGRDRLSEIEYTEKLDLTRPGPH